MRIIQCQHCGVKDIKLSFSEKEILDVLRTGNKNITELSKKIKLSYKNTFLSVKRLEKEGYIVFNKDNNKQGEPMVCVFKRRRK